MGLNVSATNQAAPSPWPAVALLVADGEKPLTRLADGVQGLLKLGLKLAEIAVPLEFGTGYWAISLA